MTIRPFNPSESTADLSVDGATIAITGHVVFEVPEAAALMSTLPPELRLGAIEDCIEKGAATVAAIQTNAHVVLLENTIEGMVTKLAEALGEQLEVADENSAEKIEKLLANFATALSKLLAPFDPNTKNGIPSVMVDLLNQSNKAAMEHIAAMLNDTDEGALGKAVKKITAEMKEVAAGVTKVIVEREALRTKSNRRGGSFEEVLSVRLPILARGMGRVEHCGNTEGDRARKTGDYVLTIETVPGGESANIAIEAKSQRARFSVNAIRAELSRARANRHAVAGVFVVENVDILPDGIGFGQVSECDFFVAFDPEVGDETALVCALYLARVTALGAIANAAGDEIDMVAVQHEIGGIRGMLEHFSKMDTCLSRIDRENSTARALGAAMRADILSALRRLDSLLSE